MKSELTVAAEAKARGLDRDEARRQLMVDFPRLITAEIDRALDASYGPQSGERMEGGLRSSAMS
jgi:hypothetical protein